MQKTIADKSLDQFSFQVYFKVNFWVGKAFIFFRAHWSDQQG